MKNYRNTPPEWLQCRFGGFNKWHMGCIKSLSVFECFNDDFVLYVYGDTPTLHGFSKLELTFNELLILLDPVQYQFGIE